MLMVATFYQYGPGKQVINEEQNKLVMYCVCITFALLRSGQVQEVEPFGLCEW